MARITLLFLLLSALLQGSGQDDKILERGEKLLEEAKAAYDDARSKGSAAAFIDAGFKLEEARIKYIVLQEIGSPEKQKIATDRLRAVNQLGKLIHDGKVAISGAATDTPGAAPANPPPADPAAKPTSEPAKAPVDVTKRAPVPDAAKQREAEKTIRELFKDQYAKKAPADRKALSRLLLDNAAKSHDDPVACWVLCREAQDVASQNCDVRAAFDAVDAMARIFDVDSLLLKNGALASAGKAAKSPEEFGEIALALLRLIDELVVADQYDAADKACAAAVQHARKSNDAALAAKAATRAREIAEAKTLYQAMKNVLETIAKNPEDPGANLEMGKFLCFVKGGWDLGLRFLVKGSDAALKSLAEKDLASPAASAERVSLADGWYALAEKEKSPLRKSQTLAHCRMLYESALPDAAALARIKIEKRLEELEGVPSASGGINLLSLVDPRRHQAGGEFQMAGGALVTPAGAPYARVEVAYTPPAEYDVTIVLERVSGTNSFNLGLVADGTRFVVAFDGRKGGEQTFLDGLKSGDGTGQQVLVQGKQIEVGSPATIVCNVRKFVGSDPLDLNHLSGP